MAGGINAYTSPGVLQLVNKSAKAKMQFTKPRDASNILIEFFETDSWISNGKTITESNSPRKLLSPKRFGAWISMVRREGSRGGYIITGS